MLLAPPLALASGFRGMPRTSPAGSPAQLCTRCYPAALGLGTPGAHRLLPLSHLQPRPNSGKFPSGRHLPRDRRSRGIRRRRRRKRMLRRAHSAPGVSPGPARAVLGINPSIPPPSPFFNLYPPALSLLTWAAGAPKRGAGRCGRRPKFAGGGRGQIPQEWEPPGCTPPAERAHLLC